MFAVEIVTVVFSLWLGDRCPKQWSSGIRLTGSTGPLNRGDWKLWSGRSARNEKVKTGLSNACNDRKEQERVHVRQEPLKCISSSRVYAKFVFGYSLHPFFGFHPLPPSRRLCSHPDITPGARLPVVPRSPVRLFQISDPALGVK